MVAPAAARVVSSEEPKAPGYRRSVLPSGITVVTESLPDRRSMALGAWVRNGARDEPEPQAGIAHFVEHMMFKGTTRRDARAIARSLESVGGHLDAFTAREQVCYYARALSESLPETVDVLADILCHSRFAPEDVTREKDVVREEILSCEDNPDDKIGELLSAEVWGGHPLGRPILGVTETLDGLTSPDLHGFVASRYRGDQLMVSAAGGLEHNQVCDLVERHFTPPSGEAPVPSGPPPEFRPRAQHVERTDLQQLYLSLGTRGLRYEDPNREALQILHTLLGGGMSSRLFQSIREDLGLAYSVYSALDFHRDAGMVTIHMGVSPSRGRESLARLRHELELLRREGPTEDEVSSARQQLIGGIVMGEESVSSRMYHLAHDELYCGRLIPGIDLVERLKGVTREQVAAAAHQFLDPTQFTLVALGPVEGGPLSAGDWPTAS